MRTTLAALVVLATLALAAPAAAVPPGADGLLAYQTPDGVALVHLDGSGKQVLGPGTFSPIGWSPNGRLVGYGHVLSETEFKIAVRDVVSGTVALLDAPPSSDAERVSITDLTFSRDGGSILAVAVHTTFDPETGDFVDAENVLLRWPNLETGTDPEVVTTSPDVTVRWLDVSAADGSLATAGPDPEGDDALRTTPFADPFGGTTRLLRENLDGASYAPDGSAIMTADDQFDTFLRVPAAGGDPTTALDESYLDLGFVPKYTPSGQGIAFGSHEVVEDEEVIEGMWRFSPAGPADQVPTLVPNTGDAQSNPFFAVQPILRTTLDVDPVILRLNPLKLNLLSFSGRLTDRFGPVAGAPVTFRTKSGAAGCTATTNAAGVASCTASLPWVLAVLQLGVDGSYPGDATHTPAAGSAGIVKP